MLLKNGAELVHRSKREAAVLECLEILSESFQSLEYSLEEPTGFEALRTDGEWLFLINENDEGFGWKVLNSGAGGARATWNLRIASSLRTLAGQRGWYLRAELDDPSEWWMAQTIVNDGGPGLYVAAKSSEAIKLIESDSRGIERGRLFILLDDAPFFGGTRTFVEIDAALVFDSGAELRGTVGTDSRGCTFFVDEEFVMREKRVEGLVVELGTIECTAEEIAALTRGSKLQIETEWPKLARLKLGDMIVATASITLGNENLQVEIKDVFLRGKALKKETNSSTVRTLT